MQCNLIVLKPFPSALLSSLINGPGHQKDWWPYSKGTNKEKSKQVDTKCEGFGVDNMKTGFLNVILTFEHNGYILSSEKVFLL